MTSTVLPFTLEEPGESPLLTLAASRQVSLQNIDPLLAPLLDQAIAKAHVGLCGYSAVISVGCNLQTDFQVPGPGQIILHPRAFASPALLECCLRHAIELTLWRQGCSGTIGAAQSIAVALLAALAARRFYLQMPAADRQDIAKRIPQWLRDCAEPSEPQSEERAVERMASHLDRLMEYQGERLQGGAPVGEAIQIACQYAAVANPTEYLLTQQGDERLLIDPATGLNKYGCSPRPRPEAITFSSCTASSVSEFAYREAELLRHRLMRTLPRGNLAAQYELEMEGIRTNLSELFDLAPLQTEVILSSSGTDAELYPLVLFRSPDKKKLVNIVVAPDEVGSGTVLAAGGRHFSARSPHGAALRQGDAIEDLDAEAIEVVGVPVRGGGGSSLTEKEFKQRITDAVAEAVKRADIVILHIVDNTKTGLVAPDVDFVLGLQETYGAQLRVLVDACQFRLEKTNLHRYLAHGFCVLITGSKFFTGPPFCGALLIPHRFDITGGGLPLPRGFADYFTSSEVPRVLLPQAQHLSSALNLGLLFRWSGALMEMKAFYSVLPEQRTLILKTFRSQLIHSIRGNPDLFLLDCPQPQRWKESDQSLWDAQPTIFSFAVCDPGPDRPGQWLGIPELKIMYQWLNRDCAEWLPPSAPAEDRTRAAQRCHIGQPVTIARPSQGGETGALRIACGARLVYGITYDGTLGRTPAERFQRELNDAQTVLAKVSLILKYWTCLKKT